MFADTPADPPSGAHAVEEALPRAELRTADATVRFMLAGDAHVTFQSEKTGTRFTFHVEAIQSSGVVVSDPVTHFVRVLTAPEHYEYVGHIYKSRKYSYGRRSRISKDAPSACAFEWVWERLIRGEMPTALAVYHEGRCGRCGRRLTVPESILTGLGPECARKTEGG